MDPATAIPKADRAGSRPPEPLSRAPSDAEIRAELSDLANQRVAVAMSGGVDSAVTAWVLKRAGARPVGLALRLHDPDPDHPLAPRACCPPDDLQDARRVGRAARHAVLRHRRAGSVRGPCRSSFRACLRFGPNPEPLCGLQQLREARPAGGAGARAGVHASRHRPLRTTFHSSERPDPAVPRRRS